MNIYEKSTRNLVLVVPMAVSQLETEFLAIFCFLCFIPHPKKQIEGGGVRNEGGPKKKLKGWGCSPGAQKKIGKTIVLTSDPINFFYWEG